MHSVSARNAFGICKGRFILLNRPLECAKEDIIRASFLITAIFILHNFLIEENANTPIEVDQHSVVDANGVQNGNTDDVDEEEGDIQTRDILLQHMCWLQNK